MSGTGPSTATIWGATGPSPLYVVEPDIPEGMTVPIGAGGARLSPELGLLAHVGAWQRRHWLRECRREAGPLASLHPTASSEAWVRELAREWARHGHRVKED